MIYGIVYFNFSGLYFFSILLLQCGGHVLFPLVPVNKNNHKYIFQS